MTTGKGGSRRGAKKGPASRHNASNPNRAVAPVRGKTDAQQPRSEVGRGVAAVRAYPSAQGPYDFGTIPVVSEIFGIPLHPTAPGLGVNESSVLRVFTNARRLIRRGWCQQAPWCDSAGDFAAASRSGRATHFSLVGALRTAGQGQLVVEYCVKLARKVLGEWELNVWNDNPVRTKAQVLALLDACIERAGGRSLRRGGWACSHGHLALEVPHA